MSLKGGETSGDSSPRWYEQISQLAHSIWLRAIVLLDLGTSPTDLKRDRAHHSILMGAYSSKCGIVSVLGVYHLSISFLGGEEPPIIYVQDVHIIIVECVDGLCGCH